jgi:hypothetical protein
VSLTLPLYKSLYYLAMVQVQEADAPVHWRSSAQKLDSSGELRLEMTEVAALPIQGTPPTATGVEESTPVQPLDEESIPLATTTTPMSTPSPALPSSEDSQAPTKTSSGQAGSLIRLLLGVMLGGLASVVLLRQKKRALGQGRPPWRP